MFDEIIKLLAARYGWNGRDVEVAEQLVEPFCQKFNEAIVEQRAMDARVDSLLLRNGLNPEDFSR